MSAFDNLASRTTQWVIGDTLYFNSTTHSFVRGDLEIDGSHIKRILPPKTSRRTDVLSGHEIVCLPGLINPDAGLAEHEWISHSRELALCGITTAGAFHRGLPESDTIADSDGVRRLIYVQLDEHKAGTGSGGINRQALEGFERAVNANSFGNCAVFPAVVPGEIWSAASLLAVASLAERLGRMLCIRLCQTKEDADDYRQTRFFTEIGLLSYLSILTNESTVFGISQLSRGDVMMLRESTANLVCAPESMSESLIEHHCSTLWIKNRAVGLSISRDAIADLNRYALLIVYTMALMHKSESVNQTCDALVDSLTHSAALALGLRDIGSIAADMRADLCLFDRPADLYGGRDSLYFIKLLASGRPRHVLIDGLPAVVDGACVGDLANA
jgi:cytosine/adenosine deaminase-related metal-dependent hydrolase